MSGDPGQADQQSERKKRATDVLALRRVAGEGWRFPGPGGQSVPRVE